MLMDREEIKIASSRVKSIGGWKADPQGFDLSFTTDARQTP